MKLVFVMPVFNEAPGLENVLNQIRRISEQSPYDVQCSIVDDGSTDDSFDVLSEWRDKSGVPTILIGHTGNEGITSTLKTAHFNAVGLSPDYVLRVDADGHLPIEPIVKQLTENIPKNGVVVASRIEDGTGSYEQARREDFMRIVRDSNELSSPLSKPALWVPDVYKINGLPNADPSLLGYQLYDGATHKQLMISPLVSMYRNRWGFDYVLLLIASQLGKEIKTLPIIEAKPNPRTREKIDELFDTYIDIVSIPLGHRSHTLSKFYTPILRQA